MRHDQIIRLVIAYTLTGAVVFTVIVTCLLLVGWMKFADSEQQQKLFYVLIVEIIAISVGYFSGFLKLVFYQFTQLMGDVTPGFHSRLGCSDKFLVRDR